MALINKTKNNTNCCVFGCHSRKGKDGSIHFHYFPKKDCGIRVKLINNLGEVEEMDKRKAWERVLSMTNRATDSLRVCSKHFKSEDYCARGVKLKQPKLLKCAVPSQNLPNMLYHTESEKNHTDSCKYSVKKRKVKEKVDGSNFVLCKIQASFNSKPNLNDNDAQNLYNALTEKEKDVVENLLNINQPDTKEEEIITIVVNDD